MKALILRCVLSASLFLLPQHVPCFLERVSSTRIARHYLRFFLQRTEDLSLSDSRRNRSVNEFVFLVSTAGSVGVEA